MKQIYTMISAICLSSLTYGQAVEQGNIKIDLDGGVGLYGSGTSIIEYQGETEEDVLEDGGSAYINLNVAYSIVDRLSLGFNFKTGGFIADDSYDKNKFNDFGLQARFYVLNLDKFTIDANASFGLAYLNQQDDEGGSSSNVRWSGTDLGFGVGFNFFFTENIGMNLGINYDMYNFKLKSIELYGEDFPLPDDLTYRMKYNGPEIKLGLAVKI